MHEASIAQNLLEIILDKARECKANKITLIKLKIGDFAGINQDSLRFVFENYSKGTLAEEAFLKITPIPLLGKCRKCNETFKIKKDEFKCSKCGSVEVDIISGEDLYVENIEIE